MVFRGIRDDLCLEGLCGIKVVGFFLFGVYELCGRFRLVRVILIFVGFSMRAVFIFGLDTVFVLEGFLDRGGRRFFFSKFFLRYFLFEEDNLVFFVLEFFLRDFFILGVG